MVNGLNGYTNKNFEGTIAVRKNSGFSRYLNTRESKIKYQVHYLDRIFRILVPTLYSLLLIGYWVSYSVIRNKNTHTK